MRTKRVVTAVLLVFVVISVGYLVWTEVGGRGGDAPVSPAAAPGSGVTVYYFHGNTRCATCRKIEGYTREVLSNRFSAALSAGSIVWQPVNVDEARNRQYVERYQLAFRSVVLSRAVAGAETGWTNLVKVWELVGDKGEFQEYVGGVVGEYLENADGGS